MTLNQSPQSTGAFSRSVETLERYAKYIGPIRARTQLASIAVNSLAAWHVREAASALLGDIPKKSIRDIFSGCGIECTQVPNSTHRNAVEIISSLNRA